LITADTAALDLAAFGGTLEEMVWSAVVGFDLDIGLEETVDW